MYKITKKEQLSDVNFLMQIEAPLIAKSGKPGQFIIVISTPQGERIPLTIADLDIEHGLVTIVFQSVGASTMLLSKFNVNDELYSVVGPLGKPSDLLSLTSDELSKKDIVFIAGGVGIAPIYPQVKYMHQIGKKVDVIIGARNKDLLFWIDKMKEIANQVYICTDDGSFGYKGNVTDLLNELVINQHKSYNHAVIIGPIVMMKFGVLACSKLNIHSVVSMNPIMVDGTGMCGACRLSIGNETKFACVDGPEFDGELVDFDLALKRSKAYKNEENIAKDKLNHQCSCHKEGK